MASHTQSLEPCSPYVLPLTREGYRQWILNLHTPVVVVLATQQARRDMENACGISGDSSPRSSTFSIGASKVSFASLFQPFGCLPPYNPHHLTSPRCHPVDQTMNPTTRSYGCPQNVTIRVFDKVKTLDFFPVRFLDIEDSVAMSTAEADSNLLHAVENQLPSIDALRLVHRLHPYSARKSDRGSSESGHAHQQPFQLVDPLESSGFPTPFSTLDQSSSPSQSPTTKGGTFSIVSSTYPHADLRLTDTYRKAYASQPINSEVSDSKTKFYGHAENMTEAEIYHQLFLDIPSDSSAVSSASQVPCIWWDKWTEQLCRSLEFSENETLSLPLGFVFIASTKDPDPAAAFEELGQANKSLPPLCRQQLVDSNAVRAYVLVHMSTTSNVDDDDQMVSNAFGSVCSSFPPSSCHILMFRASTGRETLYSLLQSHFDSLQALTHTIITRSIVPFLERLVKRLNDNLGLHRKGLRSHLRNLWGRRSRVSNGGSSVANPTNPSEVSSLDPTNELLSIGPGTADENASTASKKEKGKGEISSQSMSIEVQGRVFADLLFFLGDYTQAASAYRNAANDFRHARSTKQLANTLEMLGIALCLSGGVRSDVDSAFAQSITNYMQCNLIRHVLRSQIHACRALVCMDPFFNGKDAAAKFDRLSCDIVAQESYNGPSQPSNELEGSQRQAWMRSCSVRAALLLEQAGICFGLSGPRYLRKMQFFLVLAGHTFNKSGLKRHALRCYSVVIAHLGDSRWSLLNSLVLQSMSPQFSSIPATSTDKPHVELSSSLPVPILMSSLRSVQPTSQFLPMACIPQPIGTRNKLTTTLNREATYLKEFLFVYKIWFQQIESKLQSINSTEADTCLQAIRSLRFELNIPAVQNASCISVLLEGDELPECEKQHELPGFDAALSSQQHCVVASQSHLCTHAGERTPVSCLAAEALGIPMSASEQKELTWMSRRTSGDPDDGNNVIINPFTTGATSSSCKHDRPPLFELHGSLLRAAAVESIISVEVQLTNPLQVPLECKNFSLYGLLIESFRDEGSDTSTQPSALDLFQQTNEPCVVDQDASIVEFVAQNVRFEPKGNKLLRFQAIPKRIGRLYIRGLRWELYGSLKTYKPFDLHGKVKLKKDIIMDEINSSQSSVPRPSSYVQSVLPGELHSSNPLAELLYNEPVEIPLSPLESEWKSQPSDTELSSLQHHIFASIQSPPLSPLRIARQAILISHLSSQSLERARMEVQYSKDLRLTLDISASLPRLSYRFIDWPDSPIVLGQRLFTTILELQNVGKLELANIRIAVEPRSFVFFSDALCSSQSTQPDFLSSSSPNTHLWNSTQSLTSGSVVQIPLVLRGSTLGKQPIGFCILAETSPTTSFADNLHPILHMSPSSSVVSVAGSNHSPESYRSQRKGPFEQATTETPWNRPASTEGRTRKWLLVEKQLYIVPGINVHLCHHASWQELGQYIAVCQIDNQIPLPPLASLTKKQTPCQPLMQNEDPFIIIEEALHLHVTKIQGFLTYGAAPKDLKFFPMELKSLTDSFHVSSTSIDPRPDDRVFTDGVYVPFDKSIQLLFRCKPFGPLTLKGWKNLSAASSSIRLTPLLHIYQVTRSTELKKNLSTSLKTHNRSSLDKQKLSIAKRGGLSNSGPTVDLIVSWEVATKSTNNCIARGEQFVYQIPFFLPAAACPLKFQIHPPCKIIQQPNNVDNFAASQLQELRQGILLQKIQLTLQNISPSDCLSITVEADTEASARALSFQDYQDQDSSRLHHKLLLYVQNVVNTSVKAKDVPAFLGEAANRFPASGGFLLGQTCFSIKKLRPGEVFSASLSFLSPRPGVFNLNKFRFIVQPYNSSAQKIDTPQEKVFAFPFQSLIYHRRSTTLPASSTASIDAVSSEV